VIQPGTRLGLERAYCEGVEWIIYTNVDPRLESAAPRREVR